MAAASSLDDLLARSALFGALGAAERVSLASQMRDVVLAPGQQLFSRGDPGREIYLVVEGRLRMSVLSAYGRELSFAHAKTGDVFGEIAALDGGQRSADATAITHVRLKALSQAGLYSLLASNPAVAHAAIKLVCSRIRDVSDHFETIALHPVDVRLARLLLDRLGGVFTARGDAATSVPLEMSQSELGLLIGSTRQRTNAALALLEKRGAIRRSGKLLLCSVAELKRAAQRD